MSRGRPRSRRINRIRGKQLGSTTHRQTRSRRNRRGRELVAALALSGQLETPAASHNGMSGRARRHCYSWGFLTLFLSGSVYLAVHHARSPFHGERKNWGVCRPDGGIIRPEARSRLPLNAATRPRSASRVFTRSRRRVAYLWTDQGGDCPTSGCAWQHLARPVFRSGGTI